MPSNWGTLREPRLGIMLHYDASTGTDAGALAWFAHPDCRVSYNYLVDDDGDVHVIAPPNARAWHAGACRSSDAARLPYRDANSAFYGVAWAGGGRRGDVCPERALAGITVQCVTIFRAHRWPAEEVWRIVGHRTEAWPRGRKPDPEGPRHPNATILSVLDVRARVVTALLTGGTG